MGDPPCCLEDLSYFLTRTSTSPSQVGSDTNCSTIWFWHHLAQKVMILYKTILFSNIMTPYLYYINWSKSLSGTYFLVRYHDSILIYYINWTESLSCWKDGQDFTCKRLDLSYLLFERLELSTCVRIAQQICKFASKPTLIFHIFCLQCFTYSHKSNISLNLHSSNQRRSCMQTVSS